MSINEGQASGIQFYSKVRINGQLIANNNIDSLTIREWTLGFLPKLELTIYDAGALLESVNLRENDEIDVTLAKHFEVENQLNMVFLLNDYSVSVIGDNRMFQINISGFLKVEDMFIEKTRSFNSSTSVDILRRIASESELGFRNPRNIISADKMNWIQSSKSNYEFIKHVLKRSNVYNDVLFFYADHKNEFVVTSLNKEIDKKEERIAKFNVSETETKTDPRDNTVYYNAYDILNKNGYVNKTIGYGSSVDYYNTKENKCIKYDRFKKMGEMSFVDDKYKGNTVYGVQGGIYNNLNLYGEKYYESFIRNSFLIKNFFAFSVVIQINSEENINLFDKINLVMPSNITEEFNEIYSGSYLVGGIIHNIQSGGIYKKMLSLHKNGMNRGI